MTNSSNTIKIKATYYCPGYETKRTWGDGDQFCGRLEGSEWLWQYTVAGDLYFFTENWAKRHSFSPKYFRRKKSTEEGLEVFFSGHELTEAEKAAFVRITNQWLKKTARSPILVD